MLGPAAGQHSMGNFHVLSHAPQQSSFSRADCNSLGFLGPPYVVT